MTLEAHALDVQVRRLLTAGTWLATTVGATGLVWTATSVVAGDVTDRPAPVIAHREVLQALQVESLGARTTTTVATARPPTSNVARVPAPTAPVGGPTTAPAPEPSATLPPPLPTTTTTSTATVAPTSPPTTPRPINPTATTSTAGGVVTASCSGYFIRLVAATPADGYAVDVLDRGPATVDVHFVGPAEAEEIRVRLVCFDGRPIRIPDQHQGPGTTPGPP